MKELEQYREEIDRIDSELVRLFEERLRVAEKIAAVKVREGLAIVDPAREERLLTRIAELSSPEYADCNREIFRMLMRTSAEHQRKVNEEK